MMATTIKAIETAYAGYMFRSRLEARWAVFFDALRIPYRYETEGFALPDGTWYLPDFWLPEHKTWIEIKGSEEQAQADGADGKLRQLAEATRASALCFFGDCTAEHNNLRSFDHDSACGWVFSRRPGEDGEAHGPYWDNHFRWCRCPRCGIVGLSFEGRAARLCSCFPGDDKGYNADDALIDAAFRAAKSYRFDPKGRERQEAYR